MKNHILYYDYNGSKKNKKQNFPTTGYEYAEIYTGDKIRIPQPPLMEC